MAKKKKRKSVDTCNQQHSHARPTRNRLPVHSFLTFSSFIGSSISFLYFFFFTPSATWLLLAAAFVSREPGGLRPGSCSMEIITATTSETYLPPRKPFCQQVWSTITRGSGWILHDQIINPPVQGREPDRNTSGESTLRGFLALFFICYPPPTDE